MAVLVGYAAYILASATLAAKLLLLWRRSKEAPELAVGGAFLLGGSLGFTAWLVLGIAAMQEAAPGTLKAIATGGLVVTVLGSLSNGIGTWLIFRRDAGWAKALVAVIGTAMAAGVMAYGVVAQFATSLLFWWTLTATAVLYGWNAVEAWSLSRVLKKRARLGLADPLVAHRTLMWAASSATAVLTVAISFAARLAYGAVSPPWTGLLTSGILLVGASAIWLGFFPPDAWRTRIAQARGEA